MLFVKDATTRNEALSRIFWLLAADEDSKNYLPKITTLQDKTLNSACHLKIVYDINKNRNTQHYYEVIKKGTQIRFFNIFLFTF